MMTLEEAISAKAAEIVKMQGVLERYGRGRWYWKLRRDIEELETQLADLKRQQEKPNG